MFTQQLKHSILQTHQDLSTIATIINTQININSQVQNKLLKKHAQTKFSKNILYIMHFFSYSSCLSQASTKSNKFINYKCANQINKTITFTNKGLQENLISPQTNWKLIIILYYALNQINTNHITTTSSRKKPPIVKKQIYKFQFQQLNIAKISRKLLCIQTNFPQTIFIYPNKKVLQIKFQRYLLKYILYQLLYEYIYQNKLVDQIRELQKLIHVTSGKKSKRFNKRCIPALPQKIRPKIVTFCSTKVPTFVELFCCLD
eukprot:TRINITY_DN7967_c0_g2_i3.p3 TRINITY_DN7967_c0_g2~~TRINITY_DN7967_c0_g2_i3.p3  ORF type:complete len:260 (+),score=-19.26 TRINITY_DN7967_c0_g2_i3:201-980(+)